MSMGKLFLFTLTLYASVALLPVFLYAVMHAQNYTKQLLNVSECVINFFTL